MKHIKLFENFNFHMEKIDQEVNDIFLPFMDYGAGMNFNHKSGDNQLMISETKFNRLDKKMVTDHNQLTKEVFSGINLSLDGEFKINKESLLELNDSIKRFEDYFNYTLDSIFCTMDSKVQAVGKSRYAWFNSVDSIEEYLQEKRLDNIDLYFLDLSLAFYPN